MKEYINVLVAAEKMNHYQMDMEDWVPVVTKCRERHIPVNVVVHKNRIKNHDKWLEFFDDGEIITEQEYDAGRVINSISDYAYGQHAENWYKRNYGLGGDENFMHRQTMMFRCKNLRGYIGAGQYDCYKQSYRMNSYSLGIPRYDIPRDIVRSKTMAFLNDRGYDSDKPTILFTHTWAKGDWHSAGKCDSDHVLDLLKNYTSTFNIIHKSHPQDSTEYKGLIDIKPGDIFASELYSLVDLTFVDYGASALEPLYLGLPFYCINGPDDAYSNYELKPNMDVRLHEIAYNIHPSEVPSRLDVFHEDIKADYTVDMHLFRNLMWGDMAEIFSVDRWCTFLNSLATDAPLPFMMTPMGRESIDISHGGILEKLDLFGRTQKKRRGYK